MSAQSRDERGARMPWRPPLRLLPFEAAAASQLTEDQLPALLTQRALHDVGPDRTVEFDPVEVRALANLWAAGHLVSQRCALAARLVAEGRVPVPRPERRSARPPTPQELVQSARPMDRAGPLYLDGRPWRRA
jgi:hypothetical protein